MIPVIAIDGPSASGKGTVAQRVAEALGFAYLDSGAIYRVTALAAQRASQEAVGGLIRLGGLGVAGGADGLDGENTGGVADALAALAGAMPLRFAGGRVWLGESDVTEAIRSEECGANASRIAAIPPVRAALLQRQRDFRVAPGLVADGRDMASVVFPHAALKVFLKATAEERAWRRVAHLAGIPLKDAKYLIEKEKDARLTVLFNSVLSDLQERDRRDAGRAAAPLKQVEGALLLDTTNLSIEAAVAQILGWWAGVKK